MSPKRGTKLGRQIVLKKFPKNDPFKLHLPRNPTTGCRPRRGNLPAEMESFSGQRPGRFTSKNESIKVVISCIGVEVLRQTDEKRGREGRGIQA